MKVVEREAAQMNCGGSSAAEIVAETGLCVLRWGVARLSLCCLIRSSCDNHHGLLSRSEFHEGQVPLNARGSCSWCWYS